MKESIGSRVAGRRRVYAVPMRFPLKQSKGKIAKSIENGTYRRNPYKQVWYQGRSQGIHRVLWQKKHGPIPKGMVVHHKNHNKGDFRQANLAIAKHGEHSQHHGGDWSKGSEGG